MTLRSILVSVAALRHINRRGFSFIELFVVMVIIIILSIIAFQSYTALGVRQRDSERQSQLYRFAKLLEQYRNDNGAYPCGTGVAGTGTDGNCAYDVPHTGYVGSVDQLYEISCSDNDPLNANSYGNDTKEKAVFLNGGQCCGNKDSETNATIGKYVSSFPDPTSTPSGTGVSCDSGFFYVDVETPKICDDSAWGLYRWGYSEANQIVDPLNSTASGKQYAYCYAVAGAGRKEYALFVRMEDSLKNKSDEGGVLNSWYEIYSAGYNKSANDGQAHGWTPLLLGSEWQ